MPHCGGVFTEPSGTILGPTEPAVCLYLIQQPAETQIQLDLKDMDLFELDNCNLNSIEVKCLARLLLPYHLLWKTVFLDFRWQNRRKQPPANFLHRQQFRTHSFHVEFYAYPL